MRFAVLVSMSHLPLVLSGWELVNMARKRRRRRRGRRERRWNGGEDGMFECLREMNGGCAFQYIFIIVR